MSADFIELSDIDVKAKLENATGILVFYKKLCPHYKALRTVLQKLRAIDSSATIMQIDSEENMGAMSDLKVEKVPVILIFKNGNVTDRKMGLMDLREHTTLYQVATR